MAGNRLIPVGCATLSLKKKYSADIGSCNGLLGKKAEHPAASQDAGGRLLPTGQGKLLSTPGGSLKSSRSSNPRGFGHLLANLGDGCRSPTPSKKSRLELLPPREEAAPLPQADGSTRPSSDLRRKNEGNKIVLSASVSDHNVIQDTGNVYNMRVRF